MEEKLKLSPPWITYCHKVKKLFENDKDVLRIEADEAFAEYTNVREETDETRPFLRIFVGDPYKADAIAKLLPEEKKFGNVTLKICVIPAYKKEDPYVLLKTAFRNNPIVEKIGHLNVPGREPMDYVMFKPEVVQFYNDNLSDPYGNETTLYQTIASEVLKQPLGVFFCTSLKK